MTVPATLSAFTPETLRAMLDEITRNPEQYCYVNCGLPSEQCACYLGTSARLELADKAPALAQALLDALSVIADRDKTIAELREEVEAWVGIYENCDITTGYCCCGDSMDNHQEPMNCGHSPVDHGAYVADGRVQSSRAALSQLEAKGGE